jgi:TP901 family phage tail tape measure protein
MASVADVYARLILDDAQAKKDLGKFGTDPAAQTAGKNLGKSVTTGLGKAFTAAGASSGLMLSGAVEAAGAFDQQLRTIQTVATDLSDVQLAKIGDDIQGLARETGKSTDDLTAGFYDLVSAGVPAEDAIGVLRDSAKLATGALGSTAESVDLVTSALNAYGLGADQSSRVTDIFAKAVADGKVTASELGNSLAQVAPIAASAGVSLEEVSAGYALLTAKGEPAAGAATKMRAAISALLTPNEALNRIQAQTGINFTELARTDGLAVALEKLREVTAENGGEFDKLSTALEAVKDDAGGVHDVIGEFRNNLGLTEAEAKTFEDAIGKKGMGQALSELRTELGAGEEGFAKALGSTDALGFALATTGENAGAMAAQIEESGNATGLAQKQYDIASKGAEATAARAAQTVGTFLQDIGEGVLPIAGPALLTINQLGPALGGLISPAKLAGSAIGGIAGRAIPAMISGLGLIIPAITPALSAIGAAIPTIITAAMALWPVLLVAAIIAGIVFLINNPEIVDQLATFAGEVLTNIANFLGALPQILLDVFTAAFDAVIAAIPGLIGGIVQIILSIPGKVAGIGAALFRLWFGVWTKIIGFVAGVVGRIVGFVLSITGKIVNAILRIALFFQEVKTKIGATVLSLVGQVVGFFMSIPGKLISLGVQIVTNIIRGLASLPGRLADAIRNAFANLRIDIGPFHISAQGVRIDLPDIRLPSFDTGAVSVPSDMLAMVHEGEMIIPAAEAAMIRAGTGTVAVENGPSGSGGSEGGVTVNLDLYGLPMRAQTPGEVVRQIRRVGSGIIEPKTIPAWHRVPSG